MASLHRSQPLFAIALLLSAATSARAQDQLQQRTVVVEGSARVPPGRTVESLVVFEGPTRVDGTVQRDVVALDGDVYVTGAVGGDVVALGGVPHIASGATIGGDIISSRAPSIAQGAHVNGEIRRAEHHASVWGGVLAYFLTWLGIAISAGLLALLLGIFVPPRASDAVYETARAEPGISFGVGVLIGIGLPMIAVAAILTIVGIPLGVALLFALVLIAFIGFVASGWILGRAIAERTHRAHETRSSRLGWALIGVGILCAGALVPFVGGLVWIIASAFGIGAGALAAYRARRPRVGPREARPATTATPEQPTTFEPPPYPEERPAGA